MGSAPHFGNFEPNPQYESAVEGVALFRRNRCDSVVAIGGGSALDVAKCIKLYAPMPDNISFLEQPPAKNAIGLLAIAKGCGYSYAVSVSTFEDLVQELHTAEERKELSFIEVKSSIGARNNLGRPSTFARENKKDFMSFLNN